MSADTTAHLQVLIDRLRQGDDTARRELLERAYLRMRRLAGRLFHQSFPALHNRHELDSIVHDSWLRLLQALQKTHPPTVADFFRLAAHKIRQVLLDLADRQGRLRRREAASPGNTTQDHLPPEFANNTYDPARMALWTEFHQKVSALGEEERAVFELHYYLDLPQVEIARLLSLHPRKVSYLWIAATEKLADGLGDAGGLL
jgi:RNA polymerase sigma factor (sigma-70 family)